MSLFFFSKVCDWLYPLTADTPVLLANSGIFMFPDSLAETPGSYVGLVLSSELPVADREMFKDVLLQLADLRVQVSLYCQCGADVRMGMHVGGVTSACNTTWLHRCVGTHCFVLFCMLIQCFPAQTVPFFSF